MREIEGASRAHVHPISARLFTVLFPLTNPLAPFANSCCSAEVKAARGTNISPKSAEKCPNYLFFLSQIQQKRAANAGSPNPPPAAVPRAFLVPFTLLQFLFSMCACCFCCQQFCARCTCPGQNSQRLSLLELLTPWRPNARLSARFLTDVPFLRIHPFLTSHSLGPSIRSCRFVRPPPYSLTFSKETSVGDQCVSCGTASNVTHGFRCLSRVGRRRLPRWRVGSPFGSDGVNCCSIRARQSAE